MCVMAMSANNFAKKRYRFDKTTADFLDVNAPNIRTLINGRTYLGADDTIVDHPFDEIRESGSYFPSNATIPVYDIVLKTHNHQIFTNHSVLQKHTKDLHNHGKALQWSTNIEAQ